MIVNGLKAKESGLKLLKSKPLHGEVMYVNRNEHRKPHQGFNHSDNSEKPRTESFDRQNADNQFKQPQNLN